MMRLLDRRCASLRGRLSRALFACAERIAGKPSPRSYEHYAALIPTLDAIDVELNKVITAGIIEPDSHRDALLRIAMQLGRTRREGVIIRLALHDAGLLRLPPEELDKIRVTYNLKDDF